MDYRELKHSNASLTLLQNISRAEVQLPVGHEGSAFDKLALVRDFKSREELGKHLEDEFLVFVVELQS